MHILKVIHGYPKRYNAGSEVYSRTLCHALVGRGHRVDVFTRQEDPFEVDFARTEERDPMDPRVRLHVVNHPRSRDRYRHEALDTRFAQVLGRVRPDIVHVGHLNHLSTSLVQVAARVGVPLVFTLHDFWLMCPRGQFMQMHMDPDDGAAALWAACNGQDDRKCAQRCYARYFSGAPDELERDLDHWTDWVGRRMAHVREVAELVDVFLAPSRQLMTRFVDEFGLSPRKIRYLPYGFDRQRLRGRHRAPGQAFTFGYIGTHIPSKGIHLLLDAFGRLAGDVRLRIYGRPRGFNTGALRARANALPGNAAARVDWLPEYDNADIVSQVFDHVDAIVVPSVWAENAPLVIHEAQQARVPVVTADVGGMAELVAHEENGLLFTHRDSDSLSRQLARLAEEPGLAERLGARGYLHSPDGQVPSVTNHVQAIEVVYRDVMRRRDALAVPDSPGPWRITLDTNPDDCNLRCIMCEEHSVHSARQQVRRAAGQEQRRMPVELIRRLIPEAAAMGVREVIPSTMGEALLFDHFDEIVHLCTEHGLKLNLTTNGTFPRGGARHWAEKVVPIGSDVKISWNGATGATQQTIMVGSQWSKVLDNLRTFIAVRDAHAAKGGNRCRVTLQVTFLELNVRELPAIVKLAAELGVDRVKGHHLWAHFDEIQDQSMRRSPASIARWNAAVAEAERVADEHRLPSGAPVMLENIFPLDPAVTEDLAPDGPCPFLGREVWVSAQGRFNPCCAPDEQRLTLGNFGNLHGKSLSEIWHGSDYAELRGTWRNRKLCIGCNMRQPVRASQDEAEEAAR